jgi:mono/diheme cytochrome c family protein
VSARGVPVIATAVLLATGVLAASAQHRHQPPPHAPSSPSAPKEEHGPPEGWKFTWPAGDPRKGRQVFVKLECFKCHEVKGEAFPGAGGRAVGPELSHMAGHHPPEFFAEAIINPNAVIDEDPDFKGPDGSTRMPSFNESVTVQEVIDLVAYLVNLKPPARASPARQGGAPGATGERKR